MSVVPSEQILRLNCPGFGEESYLTLGRARPLDTYSVIVANPVSILHLFDRDVDSVRDIEAKLADGATTHILSTDYTLQDIESDLKQRIFELVSFLEKGGLLVYYLCRPFMVQGPTVAMDNYYWLESLAPDSPAELNARHMSAVSHGRIVEATEAAEKCEFAAYFKQPSLEWNTIIRSDFLTEGYNVLATAGPRKCIAAHLTAGDNGGRIVFLPAPYSPDFDRTLMECINVWNQGKGPSGSDSLEMSAPPPPYMSMPNQPPTMFAGLDGTNYNPNKTVEPAQSSYMPAVPKFNPNPQPAPPAPPAQAILDAVHANADSAPASNRSFDERRTADLPHSIEPEESLKSQPEKAQKYPDLADLNLRGNSNETQELRLDQMPNLTIVTSQQTQPPTSRPASTSQPRNLLKEMESMAAPKPEEAEPTAPAPAAFEPEPAREVSREQRPVRNRSAEFNALEIDSLDVGSLIAEPDALSFDRVEPPKAEPRQPEPVSLYQDAPSNGQSDMPPTSHFEQPNDIGALTSGAGFDDLSEYETAAAVDSLERLNTNDFVQEPLVEPQASSLSGFFEDSRSPEPSLQAAFAETEEQLTGETIPEAKDLIKKMEEMTKTVAPEWCETFSFPDLEDLRKERESLAETIRQTQTRIAQLDNKLATLDGLKNALLASDGEELKQACARVFKKLGWNSKQSDADSKELLLAGDEATELIARIVRSNTSAPRPDVAQLGQSVLTYWGETEIEPKGVLIASTFVQIPPSERNEADFSDALAEFAQKKSLCLMTTMQLLCMYRDLELGKLDADQIRKKVLDTNGRLVGFELEPQKSKV